MSLLITNLFVKGFNFSKSSVVFVVVFQMLLSGCGGSQSGPSTSFQNHQIAKDATHPRVYSAIDLGLRVVLEDASGKNPDIPDPHASLSVKTPLDIYTADQDTIRVDSKLFLPDPNSLNPDKKRKVFLVWPEQSLGSPIASAIYSHQVKRSDGKKLGSSKPYPVHHDTKNHRWFISVQELFEHNPLYETMDVSLDDRQMITLELKLEDGTRKVIRIGIQVSGPMGVALFLGQPAPQPKDAADLIQTTSRSGWVIHKEQVVNPTSRPFKLWVSLQSPPGSLQLISYINEFRLVDFSGGIAPPVPIPHVYRSVADLEVNQLVATHQSKNVDLLTLQTGGWEEITLEPNETMVLQWMARPASYVNPCSLPPPQQQTAYWNEPEEVVVFGNIKLTTNATVRRSKTFTLPWSFIGGELKGAWNREIRLTHPFISEADAIRPIPSTGGALPPVEFMVLLQGPLSTQLSSELISSSYDQFPCQGVFR